MSKHVVPPPRLNVQVASPALPPTSELFSPAPSSFHSVRPPSPAKQPSPASKNSLFDLDWRTPAPPSSSGRSRSSTAESRHSVESGSSGRRSWLDVTEHSPPAASTFSSPARPGVPPLGHALANESTPCAVDRTPLPSQQRDDFAWPTTPPSPWHSVPPSSTSSIFSIPFVPPLPPPVSNFPSPTSPPRPPPPLRSGTIVPSAASSASRSSTLPPAAGQSTNPLLDTRQSPSLRLAPLPPYLLGEGRHASVYLASFAGETKEGEGKVKVARRLCAAKRPSTDRESQVGALGEAFILARLTTSAKIPTSSSASPSTSSAPSPFRGSSHILRLYGVRDERDGLNPPLPLPYASTPSTPASLSRNGSKRWSLDSSRGGGPSPLKQTFGLEDSPERKEGGGAAAKGRKSRHSEPISSTAKGRLSLLTKALEPPLASSSASTTSKARRDPSPTSPSSLPPPRSSSLLPGPEPQIDLILEYCPLGHVLSFARSYPDQMDKTRWIKWAWEMSSAVEWCHSKGVLHADVKPQNVMIASDLTLRLSDFGNSLFLPPPSSPAHLFPTDPHGLGTPSYSPPEFVAPLPSRFSYPSDIFSLGVTFSTLLTAREPYEGLRSVERMMWVGAGGFWEWEERRRVSEELDGRVEKDEVEEGTELSRQGSSRSVRSGRSSARGMLRRETSTDSVRSWTSTPDGGLALTPVQQFDWETVARSLLLDDWEDEEDERVEKKIKEANPTVPSPAPSPHAQSFSHHHSRYSSSTSSLSHYSSTTVDVPSLPPPTRFYPSSTTPVQYYLSYDPSSLLPPPPSDGPVPDLFEQHIVPVAVRDLIQRMTRSKEGERPTAKGVREEIERIANAEGVEL